MKTVRRSSGGKGLLVECGCDVLMTPSEAKQVELNKLPKSSTIQALRHRAKRVKKEALILYELINKSSHKPNNLQTNSTRRTLW